MSGKELKLKTGQRSVMYCTLQLCSYSRCAPFRDTISQFVSELNAVPTNLLQALSLRFIVQMVNCSVMLGDIKVRLPITTIN